MDLQNFHRDSIYLYMEPTYNFSFCIVAYLCHGDMRLPLHVR